jgi:hypothetical protein
MENRVDEIPEKDAATLAANVCAAVLSSGKHDGRFAMSIDELRRAMDLSERQAEVATMWAAEREWVRRRANQVELKAAGIYVAKVTLQLPR